MKRLKTLRRAKLRKAQRQNSALSAALPADGLPPLSPAISGSAPPPPGGPDVPASPSAVSHSASPAAASPPSAGPAVASTSRSMGKPARTLAIVNQKGGVGKTTTAVNLATALAACGQRILLIDLDAQGNATTGLGLRRREGGGSSYDLLLGEGDGIAEAAVQATEIPGLELIAASLDLSGADLELADAEAREDRLRRSLRPVLLRYDLILIDCPPALSLLTLNALVAADAVLVPLQCEYYALEGLSMIVKTIDRVRRSFNPRLEIEGVVLTMYDRRNNLCDLVAQDVRDHFGNKVYDTIIPRNVRISEAPSHGKPVLLYDLKSAGAQSYVQLAREMLGKKLLNASLQAAS